MKILLRCFCIALLCVFAGQTQSQTGSNPSSSTASAPLSQEQGEEILNELRLIRKALEDHLRESSATRSVATVPAQGVKLAADANWFAQGSDQAPVVLVEFSDFECPYCTQFNKEVFPKLKAAYIDTGKVRFVSREYPLDFHPDAFNAALAARCGGAQDHYWQMRDLIIDNSADLSMSALEQEAQRLSLDTSKFRTCMKDDTSVAAIKRDVSDGQSIGVTGTPAFLLGKTRNNVIEGVRIDGAQPYTQLASAIDSALAATR
jgi:protein-disulfide isomerase